MFIFFHAVFLNAVGENRGRTLVSLLLFSFMCGQSFPISSALISATGTERRHKKKEKWTLYLSGFTNELQNWLPNQKVTDPRTMSAVFHEKINYAD